MSEPVISENVDVFREIRRCYRLSLDLQKEAKAAEKKYKKTIKAEAKNFKDHNEENYLALLKNDIVVQSRNELENVIYKLMTLRDYVLMLEPMMLQENLTDAEKNNINFNMEWNKYCALEDNEKVNERWQKLKTNDNTNISDIFSSKANDDITDIQKKDLKNEYEKLISEFGVSECNTFFNFLMQQVEKNNSTDHEKDISDLKKNYNLINNNYIQEKRLFLDSTFDSKVIASKDVLDTFELMLKVGKENKKENVFKLYSSKVSHGYVYYNIEEKSLNGKNKLNEIAENLFFRETDFIDIPSQNIGSAIGDGSCLLHAIFPYLTQEILNRIVQYVIENDMPCPTIYDENGQVIFECDGVTTFFDLVIRNRTYYDRNGNFRIIDGGSNINYIWYMRAAIAIWMYKKILQDNSDKEKRINNDLQYVLGFGTVNRGYIEASFTVMNAIADLTGYSIVAITNQASPWYIPRYANSADEYIRLNYSVPSTLKGKCYKENITNYNDAPENLGEVQINQANGRAKMAINDFTSTLINGNDKVAPIKKGTGSVIEPAKYKINENTEQKIIFVRKSDNHYEPVQPNGFKHGKLSEKQFNSVKLPPKQEDLFKYLRNRKTIKAAVPKNDVNKEMSNLLHIGNLPISPMESAQYLLYGIIQNSLLLNFISSFAKSEYEKKIDEFKTNWNNELNKMQKDVEKELNVLKDEFQKTPFQTDEEKNKYIDDAYDKSVDKIIFIEFLRYYVMENYFYENDIKSEFDKYKSIINLNPEMTFDELTSKFETDYKNFTESLDKFKLELQSLKDDTIKKENLKIEISIKENYTDSISKIKKIRDKMERAPEIKIYNSNLIQKNIQNTEISSLFASILSYVTPEEFIAIRKCVDEKNREVRINKEQKTVLNWLNDSGENLSTPEIYLRAYVVLKCLDKFSNDELNNDLKHNLKTILGYEKNRTINWTNFVFFKLISQALGISILIVSPGTDKDESGYCCVKSEDNNIKLDEVIKKLSELSPIEIGNANKEINDMCNNYDKGECICIHCSNGNNFAPIGYDLDFNKFGSVILPIDDEVATKDIKLLANNFLEVLHVNLSSKFLKTTKNIKVMALLSEILAKKDIDLLKQCFIDDNNSFSEIKFEKFANIILENVCNPFQISSFAILVVANLYSKGIHFSSDLNLKLFQIGPIEKLLSPDIYYEFLSNFLKIDKEFQENIIDLLVAYKESTQYVLPLVCDLIKNDFDKNIYENLVSSLKIKNDFDFYISNRKSIEEKNYKLISQLNIDENLKSDFIKKIHFFSLEELNFCEKIILNFGEKAIVLLKLPIKDFQDVTKEFRKWKNFLRLNGFSERKIRNMENEIINKIINKKKFDVKKLLTKINMLHENCLLISPKDKRDYYLNSIKYVKIFQEDLKKSKEMLQNPITNFEKLFNLCDDKILVDKCLIALELEKTNESIDFAKKLKAISEIKKSLCRVKRQHRNITKKFIFNVFKSYLANNPFDYDSFVGNLEDFIEQYRKNRRSFTEIMRMRNNLSEKNYKEIYDKKLRFISKKIIELKNDEAVIMFYLCLKSFTDTEQQQNFDNKIAEALQKKNTPQPTLESQNQPTIRY